MLHVTIKNSETNEVIHDLEAKVVGLQAVGEEVSLIRCAAEDVGLVDFIACIKAITNEAKEANKLLDGLLAQTGITNPGEVDDNE